MVNPLFHPVSSWVNGWVAKIRYFRDFDMERLRVAAGAKTALIA